jgi:hypothetical protein
MKLAGPLIFCSVALIALLVGLAAQQLVSLPPAPRVNADDWRRTATGWERNDRWLINRDILSLPYKPSEPSSSKRRFDTHPAALALWQLAAALAALVYFRERPRQLTLKSLRSFISRSFRASAFG